MSVPAFSAVNAYANAARAIMDAAKTTPDKPATGTDFADMVDQAVKSVVASGEKTEKIAAAHIVGKAGLVDVVTAVAEAELTMRTLVTVRDRVISAYQEVIRMPI